MENGDKITGEIKKLERSFIHIEPDYADSVFIIEWDQVEKMQSHENFVAVTEGGERISGSIRSDPDEPEQLLIEDEDTSIPLRQTELVNLKPVDEGFWGRFGVAIDFGLSLTKANDTKQFTTRGLASYVSEHWSLQGYVDLLRNAQKDVDDTKRSEAGANYRRFFGES